MRASEGSWLSPRTSSQSHGANGSHFDAFYLGLGVYRGSALPTDKGPLRECLYLPCRLRPVDPVGAASKDTSDLSFASSGCRVRFEHVTEMRFAKGVMHSLLTVRQAT